MLFAGVVFSHCVTTINFTPGVLRSAGLISVLLHMTRYGFVAVTLFVLVLSMQGRHMTAGQFWRRRFGLVVAPYLVWTVTYNVTDHLLLANHPFTGIRQFLLDVGRTAVTGDAKYQLYFLLISMQIYLFFPLLSRFMARTARHPWLVLFCALLVQVAAFAGYQYSSRPSFQPWAELYVHTWKFLPMYTLFVAIGMLAAQHREAVTSWLRAHVLSVGAVCVLGSALSIAAYLRATAPGVVPVLATTAWNPKYLPWFVGGFVLLWTVAMLWDEQRAKGRPVGRRIVSYATVRAFGAFAVHPLILDVLGNCGFFGKLYEWFPDSTTKRTLVLTVTVLALSLVFIEIALRTPFSRWLVARDRMPMPRRPSADRR